MTSNTNSKMMAQLLSCSMTQSFLLSSEWPLKESNYSEITSGNIEARPHAQATASGEVPANS